MKLQGKKRWDLSRRQKDEYVENLSFKLAALRAQANISQEDLANIIGISRQTYYAIENGKRTMSWNTYIGLLFFFDSLAKTAQMLRTLGAYPVELIEQFNNDPTGEVDAP